MLAGASGFALQVFLATFAVAYAVERGADRQPVLYAFALASVLSVFFVVGMGRLSDQLGRRPVMVVGLVLFIALILPMFSWLATGNVLLIFVTFTIGLACHAAIYGPLAAFISEQFGTSSRYTGASLGYQFASVFAGGLAPFIMTALLAATGSSWSVSAYILACAVVTFVSVVTIREHFRRDLYETSSAAGERTSR